MRGALWEELGQLEKSVQWLGTSNPHLPMQRPWLVSLGYTHGPDQPLQQSWASSTEQQKGVGWLLLQATPCWKELQQLAHCEP